ncbi:MAG: alpha/beta hydrolase [Bdellovibrionales bacterium]|nr:alpha/beta hydrolase [Bdellovibrionales bacterium]
MKKRKVITAATGLFILMGIGVYLIWNPLFLEGMKSRYQLWQAGVQPFQSSPGAKGLRVGQCDVNNCQCVLLIHGLGDDPTTWRRILMRANEWLKPGTEVAYAVDLASVSDVKQPESLVSKQMARKLIDWVRTEVDCKKWLVVGNSFGGSVAAWAAIQWPEGIRRLMLVSSSGLKEISKSMPKDIDPRNWTGGDVQALKNFQKRAYFKPRELPEAVWQAAAARIAESPAGKILDANDRLGESLDTHLGALKIPTIVFWGKADGIIDPKFARQFGSAISGATIREVPECGHLPQKECPVPLMAAIRDLLGAGAF